MGAPASVVALGARGGEKKRHSAPTEAKNGHSYDPLTYQGDFEWQNVPETAQLTNAKLDRIYAMLCKSGGRVMPAKKGDMPMFSL